MDAGGMAVAITLAAGRHFAAAINAVLMEAAMDDYLYTLGAVIDDGSNFRVAEVLSRLESQDFEAACSLLGSESDPLDGDAEDIAE
ncbi:MAG: hypothetical protein HONDAALG_02289 [Gammaproteobacteria bacterium]|nr:hypothetical protein [Gammaproteobacteria bacterium]